MAAKRPLYSFSPIRSSAAEPRVSRASPPSQRARASPDDITQANVDKLITVYGGSGFLGRHVIRALCKRGYRIRVAVRRPDLTGHLQPLGRVGQIHAVQANLRYPASVDAAARRRNVL